MVESKNNMAEQKSHHENATLRGNENEQILVSTTHVTIYLKKTFGEKSPPADGLNIR